MTQPPSPKQSIRAVKGRTLGRTTSVLLPIGVTIAAALGALRPLPPIRDAVTHQPVEHMRLAVGLWYIVLAPLYDVWDTMTLLPVRAHIAIIASAVALLASWKLRRLMRRNSRFGWRDAANAIGVLALVVAWYVVGALTPRPMASLEVDDPDLVVVDVHSHTEASHDGRPGFSAARNREWHHKAGYNVAYITDHGTLEGLGTAMAGNPTLAGNGTVLLPGFETRYSGQHLNVLGFVAESTYRGLSSSELASFSGRSRPPAVLTIPAKMTSEFSRGPTDGPILGVELVDGSPVGLDFGARQDDALRALAARVDAPLVVGSNTHGWGRAAPGWTVIRIPGWRRLTPRALDSAILDAFAAHEPGRVTAVERDSPEPVRERVVVADIARLTRNPLRALSRDELFAWVSWTWFAWLIATRGLARPNVFAWARTAGLRRTQARNAD